MELEQHRGALCRDKSQLAYTGLLEAINQQHTATSTAKPTLNSEIWNSEKHRILRGRRMGLSSMNNPCHRRFLLRNLCWYSHPVSWSLATLQKMSGTLITMMMKHFSTADLRNLSTHAQASPVSDLRQSTPSLAKPAYGLGTIMMLVRCLIYFPSFLSSEMERDFPSV